MYTPIVEIVGASGAGKGGDGWFDLTQAVVSYDHPRHALLEEDITIDFLNAALGPRRPSRRWSLTLETAKAQSDALARAIAAAEIEDIGRLRGTLRNPSPNKGITLRVQRIEMPRIERDQSQTALFRSAIIAHMAGARRFRHQPGM